MISHDLIGPGLDVVTERMSDTRSVTLGFWVGTGSVDETDPTWGASHFLEHLLFKGTPSRSALEIASAVDRVGGDMNAFTTKEYTAFYVRLISDALDLGMDILSDIMWSPAFREAEFVTEQQVILEEILMHNDEPADLVHEVLAEALWPGHRLGLEVLGSAESISAMTAPQVAAFHRRHYRPGNMVFAAAGELEHDRVCQGMAERLALDLTGAHPLRTAPTQARLMRQVAKRDTEQAHIALGVPAIDAFDERRYALAVIDHILGGGMSSRLFQEIREKRGLAYSVYSYRMAHSTAGAFCVYAGTGVANAAQVIEVISDELQRLASEGVSAEELDQARSHVRGATVLGLEDSGSRMSRIGHSQLVYGKVRSVAETERRFAELTLEELNSLAREIFSQEPTVAVVGPFDQDVQL